MCTTCMPGTCGDHVGAGEKLRSSTKSSSALNYCTTSLAPMLNFKMIALQIFKIMPFVCTDVLTIVAP